MIFLVGDFPAWLPLLLGFGVFGFTTALIIGGIAAGAAAAAGGTAVAIKNAVAGHWPWEDFAGWSMDMLKGSAGGLGSVVSAAEGQPTIMDALAGARQGTAGVLQGASGQAGNQLVAEAHGQTPEQIAQGGGRPSTGPLQGLQGANRYDAGDTPSRSDIFKEAGKSIGIGLGTSAGGVLLGGLGGALLGPAAEAGTAAAAPAASGAAPAAGGAIGPVAGAGATPAATSTFANVIGGGSSTAANAAPSALQSALDVAREIPSQIRNVASGIQQYTIGPVQSALENTIGETPTSILGQTAFGALKGAGIAKLTGGDPLRGAASGGAGGFVGGGLGAGADFLYPGSETNFVPTQPGMHSLLGGGMQQNPFHMAIQQAEPSYGSMATHALAPTLGGFARGAVNQAMTPMPPMPPEPMYQHRTTPLESYDIYGGLYTGNPYLRGM